MDRSVKKTRSQQPVFFQKVSKPSDGNKTPPSVGIGLQMNNHNAYSTTELTKTGPPEGDMTRSDPIGCAGHTESSISVPRVATESSGREPSTGISRWTAADADQRHIRTTNSLMRLEKLASEANRMYAELTAIGGSCASVMETGVKKQDVHPTHVMENQFASMSTTTWKSQTGTSAGHISEASKYSPRIGKSLTLSRIRVLDPESDDEELISDDEENIKLWSVSSQGSHRSTPGRLEHVRPANNRDIEGSSMRNIKSPSSADETEFTIREQVRAHSDEELDDLLIDYSLDTSLGDSSDQDEDEDDVVKDDFRDVNDGGRSKKEKLEPDYMRGNVDVDDDFVDFSDVAFSGAHDSSHSHLSHSHGRSNTLITSS